MKKNLANIIAISLISINAMAADHQILQKDREFSESEITISVGDTVTFVNKDDVVHNVFSRSPENSFEIKRQEPGTSETITFSKPGKVKAKCALHPQMVVNIEVK